MFFNYWVYAVLYVFFSLIIGQFFIEDDIKLIYYMVMFLLYISLTNIYTSTKYYIKLRNTPGIKGDRGDPGLTGSAGSDGVCVMSNACGIVNCRKLIIDTLTKKIPDYKKIRRKQSSNIELNSNDKKKLEKINYYIDILLPKCETYDKGATEFVTIIENTITPSTDIPTTASS